MVDTRQEIEKILAEIENGGEKCSGNRKSMDEVLGILLNRKSENPSQASVETAASAGSAGSSMNMAELRVWQERNNQIYHVGTDYPLGSNKKVIGKIDVLVKKIMRKLMRPIIYPIISRQNEFNASVTSSINAVYSNEAAVEGLMAAVNGKIAAANAEMEALKNSLGEVKQAYENVTTELKNMKDSLAADDVYSVIDYNKFEKYFRGEKETIKNNQKMYLPYFEGKAKVVDLGCGRGEFLELLKEYGIPAVGVDSYQEFVDECNKKHLDVVYGDAVKYISDCEDESLEGIFAAQLAEHLKTSELAKLCQSAYEKLKFGGCFIMETPNPTCLSTYTNAFYIDPTHTKPVHPQMLQYFLKEAGFTTVEIVYTETSKVPYRLPLLNAQGAENLQDFNDGINLLTEVVFGSQDYAVIAKK